MKKKDFPKLLHEELNSYKINLNFINEWYKEIINSLFSIKKRAIEIKHPRHLGDFLEDEILKILSCLFPQKYIIDKGFLLNHFSAISKEQDILIIDPSLGSSICKTESIGYYPIESAMVSIEVKSNLDLTELRKCILNCISAKKLNYDNFNYEDKNHTRLFYSIFAYTSSNKISSFQKELESITKDIPEVLRPNMIFILDQGLFLPKHNEHITLDLKTIQTVLYSYGLIENTEELAPQNFVLFFSILIEHAFHQSKERKPTPYTQYVTTPSIWKQQIDKTRDKNIPIEKYINKYSLWSDDNHELYAMYDEICPKCKTEYTFYNLPPASKQKKEELIKTFEKEGFLKCPKNKRFKCNCGEDILIKDNE